MIQYFSHEHSLGAAEKAWPTGQLHDKYRQDNKPL